MDDNKWFRETLNALFQDVRLWWLVAPWFLFLWLAQVLSGGMVIGEEARLRWLMSHSAFSHLLSQVETFWDLVRILPRMVYEFWGFRAYFLLGLIALSILLWLVNLVLTGTIIYHTMPIHKRPPRLETSLYTGLKRTPCLFLVNLIMGALEMVLFLPFLGVFLVILKVAIDYSPPAGVNAFLPVLLVSSLCFFIPLLFLAMFVVGVYQNLTYQACVQEGRRMGASFLRAWAVGRHRPGPVLLLGVIALLLAGGVELVQWVFTQTLRIWSIAEGTEALFGLLVWTVLAGIVAFLSVFKDVLVLVLYTKAWPDIAGLTQVDGDEV